MTTHQERVEIWFKNFLRTDMQLDENILSKDEYAKQRKANAISKTSFCSRRSRSDVHCREMKILTDDGFDFVRLLNDGERRENDD
jgi:hypothetical protein